MEISQETVQEKFHKKEMTRNQNSLNVKSNYKYNIVWKNIIGMIYLHLGGLYGWLFCLDIYERIYTILWFTVLGIITSMGIIAGAHRLWCHRTYKAKWPLRFLLMLLQTLVYQVILCFMLLLFICILIPVGVPCYFWNEKFIISWYMNLGRYVWTLNMTWLVNSADHIWGMKPYDVNIRPIENLIVSIFTFGEGWHNYHHVFPWDYKTSEFGYKTNFTTAFIDFCALLGQAYDLKTVPEEMITKQIAKNGNGSSCNKNKIIYHEDTKWGDKDMKPHKIEKTKIFNKKD